MSIELPAEFEAFMQQELATGQYGSEAEVVCAGLTLLQDRKRRLTELRREIDVGIEQIEKGEFIEITSEQQLKAFFEDIEVRGRHRSSNDLPQA